ncbi:hypothetical protein [Lacinutrix salivirga]
MKYLKFSKFLYLGLAAFLIYDVIKNWSTDKNRSYMSLFLFALAVFMFLFRRKFDKKYEDPKDNNSK